MSNVIHKYYNKNSSATGCNQEELPQTHPAVSAVECHGLIVMKESGSWVCLATVSCPRINKSNRFFDRYRLCGNVETWLPLQCSSSNCMFGVPKLSPEIYLIVSQLIRHVVLLRTLNQEWQRVDLSDQKTISMKQMHKTLFIVIKHVIWTGLKSCEMCFKGRSACSEVVTCTAWLRARLTADCTIRTWPMWSLNVFFFCFFFSACLWAAWTPSWAMWPVR